jgi:hypothetical protein
MVIPTSPLYLTLIVIAIILIHLWLILQLSAYGKKKALARFGKRSKERLATVMKDYREFLMKLLSTGIAQC